MKNRNRKLPPILSEAEIKTLLRHIRKPRDRALIGLMLFLGLRISEALGLKVSEIDFQKHVIRGVGKRGKAFELPVPKHLETILIEALNARPPQAEHPFLLWRLDDPAKPLGRTGAWKRVRKIGREALGRDIWPHLCRHSFASLLYKKTMDLGQVQKALRHSRLSTATIYAQLNTEDLRGPISSLDSRSWPRRLWDGLKPLTIPDLLKPRHGPVFIGEVIGREHELAEMRQVLRTGGRHCALIGNIGVGRKILLKTLYEEQKERPGLVYEMDGLKPVKTILTGLYESMKKDGLPVGELPSDKRAIKVWIDAIRPATKNERVTVFVYDSDEPNTPVLRDLAKVCTVFTATTPEAKQKVRDALFSCHEIEIKPLGKPATFALVERIMEKESVLVPDRQSYLNHIWHLSAGSPKGIIGMVKETKATGEVEPEYTGTRKVLSATPIITTIWTVIVISRYSASALSEPQLKVWATIALFGLLPFILLDKLLKMKRKKQ